MSDKPDKPNGGSVHSVRLICGSGMGEPKCLNLIILEDLKNFKLFCLIDHHGPLFDQLLREIHPADHTEDK